MKKVSKVLVGILLFGSLFFGISQIEANAAVETNMTPTQVTKKTYEYQTITIGTNVGGRAEFRFNKGDGSATKTKLGSYSVSFREYWTKSDTYNYWGRVISENYGPGPTRYGKATIRIQ